MEKFAQKFYNHTYLPEFSLISFSCSTKSSPIKSAKLSISIFANASRSLSLIMTFDLICDAIFFKCNLSSPPPLSIVSPLCEVIVTNCWAGYKKRKWKKCQVHVFLCNFPKSTIHKNFIHANLHV